jgi:hypothetical protein
MNGVNQQSRHPPDASKPFAHLDKSPDWFSGPFREQKQEEANLRSEIGI